MDAKAIKQLILSMGADLCGIADPDVLTGAPKGFHPRDVMPTCKSVIVLAKRFPVSTILCQGNVPYTIARNLLSDELDRLSVLFCIEMEKRGILAVPTGTISPTLRDRQTDRSRNIVSAKHCAVAAGLGRIGRNTMLVTPEFGNMVWLCAILCEEKFDTDTPLEGSPCPENCRICIDNCPAHALGEPAMNQDACGEYAFHTEPGDEFVFKCNKCRTLCPNRFGTLNKPAVIAQRKQ